MNRNQMEAALEAVLFTMGKTVGLSSLSLAIGQDEDTTRGLLSELAAGYEAENRGIRLLELEGSFQLCTKKEYYENLIRVAKEPQKQELSSAALETLSIIAYKQPVTKGEIQKIRGVASDYAVNRLVEYGLVYETGRLNAPGRPLLFATTEEFLRRFGVGNLDELPVLEESKIQEFKEEVRDELAREYPDGESQEDGGEAATEEAWDPEKGGGM